MREAVRKVPKRRRYAVVAILAIFVMAATVTSATARTAKPHKAGFRAVLAAVDSCGYPFGSGRTATGFNESSVLKGFSVTAPGTDTQTVNVFYSDEWALNLGGTQADIEQWDATYSSPYAHANIFADDAGSNPNKVGGTTADPDGTTANGGDPPRVGSLEDPQSRPDAPVVFLTRVPASTTDPKLPQDGDWQKFGGDLGDQGAQDPSFIGGTWKRNGFKEDVINAGVKQYNGKEVPQWNGPHADAFLANINTSAENYAMEARYDVNNNLLAWNPTTGELEPVAKGRHYKVQMMVHDGDGTSDVGEACKIVDTGKIPSEVETSPNVKLTENINISIDVSANAEASVKAGDSVLVRLIKRGTAADSTRTDKNGNVVNARGCTATNKAGLTISGGTAARRQGNDKIITITDPATQLDANGNLNQALAYPDDFGGASAPALNTSGGNASDYWWYVQYRPGTNNPDQAGSDDDCSETFNIGFTTP
jgi:hypothetical protein